MIPDLRDELQAAEKLIAAIQELSLARDLATVMKIVRRSARQLTGADGATFVLKDGTYCYYAEEDAISPLWKGHRFPMANCISGWVMMNRRPVVIPDIYQDPRIPIDAYRPTFVKSLAVVPIRPEAPLAAIGNYWASHHQTTERELELLQALANSTCMAMENIEILSDLEQRVRARTSELAAANAELAEKNRDLESFSSTVSHDLRAPLRAIKGFGRLLAEDAGNDLTPQSRGYLQHIDAATVRMEALVNDLLALARVSTAPVQKTTLDLAPVARDVLRALAAEEPGRSVGVVVPSELPAYGDRGLLRIVLENLLGNAWKFTALTTDACIEIGSSGSGEMQSYYVRDNGAGFPAHWTGRLFQPFQRLHSQAEFTGVGIGLATVRRIILKHGGEVSATGAVNQGATFTFTLPRSESSSDSRVAANR
jgi:signal transduction histidine kinase